VTAFLIDVAGPDHEAAVKTTLAKMQILKSQINNARLMADIAEEEVQKGIRQLRDNLFLSQQSHEADLVWVLGELKGVIASWGDTEYLTTMTKERVQNFVSVLSKKIKDDADDPS
jgi:hypothetical protein